MQDELRSYQIRARGLRRLGQEAHGSPECKRQAVEEYAAFKEHLARRLAELVRARRGGTGPVDDFILLDAVRQGYLAMRASQRTSPGNRAWAASVQALQNRMDYQAGLLDKDLEQLERDADDLLTFSTATLRELDSKVNSLLKTGN